MWTERWLIPSTFMRGAGRSGDQLLPVFLPQPDLTIKGDAIEKLRSEIFQGPISAEGSWVSECRQLFERLRMDGVKTVLASSAKGDELGFYKKCANIEDLVDEETSSEDADKTKPHPDIFDAALVTRLTMRKPPRRLG